MSDLFHDAVPEAYIQLVCSVMKATPWHTYQVLTKRAERLKELLSGPLAFASNLPNIWWGVSVENKKHGIPRIPHLQQTPGRVRFLSIEPLLEDVGAVALEGIHWVIVGGESGHGARRMDEAWVNSILVQCKSARVPFFFKQWGGVQKKRYGRLLGGRTYDEMPAQSKVPVASAEKRRILQAKFDTLASGYPIAPLRDRRPRKTITLKEVEAL